MKIWQIAGILALTATAGTAQAMDSTIIGGVLGGGAGAVVGNNMGGRQGAVIGGVIGAAAGAAIGKAIDERNNPYAGTPNYGATYPATNANYPVTTYPAGAVYPVQASYPVATSYRGYGHDRGRHLGHYKHKHKAKHCR